MNTFDFILIGSWILCIATTAIYIIGKAWIHFNINLILMIGLGLLTYVYIVSG